VCKAQEKSTHLWMQIKSDVQILEPNFPLKWTFSISQVNFCTQILPGMEQVHGIKFVYK
jgi:hypothetical protein